ncbi:hypothetical protein SS50377_23151 [Spironucleus salmonicida]|uniref:Uncharacterized protein n=1 Tax=Spironucleus salmonicida TaxID=348837 RepID=V6LLV0_9EUKA|nr:hypothetical protein SS50377_23151 [Spironucleus salmonicida]|eukprot:EST41674.1 hypothetical protein SS50377_18762 [Spironucleus salmonicida]
MSNINTAKLQRSHIKVADNAKFGSSTYNDTFIQYDLKEAKANMSEDKKADLRKSHFSLVQGSNMPTGISETQEEYQPKRGETYSAAVNLHGLRDNISNKLGYDAPVMETQNMADYRRLDGTYARQPLTKNLQGSHFGLGNDPNSYITENSAAYFKRDYEKPEQKSMNLRTSSIPIDEGTKNTYQTECSANYQGQPNVEKETYDLRRFQKSHIELEDGLSKMGISSTQTALNEVAGKPRDLIDIDAQKARERYLRASHLPVAEDGQFYGVTEMSAAFPGRDGIKASDSVKPAYENTQEHVCYPEKQKERISEMRDNYRGLVDAAQVKFNQKEAENIRKFMAKPTDPNSQKMSSERGDGQSETMMQYKPNSQMIKEAQEERAKFHLEALAHGRSSVQLMDPSLTNNYISQTQAMLQDSVQFAGKKLAQPINNQLWRSDVMLKSDERNSYETENQAAFKPDAIGSSERVNQDMVNQLRRSHFQLGEDRNNWKSEMQSEYQGHDSYKDDGKYHGYTDKYEENMFMM